jgi:hypothetical protein
MGHAKKGACFWLIVAPHQGQQPNGQSPNAWLHPNDSLPCPVQSTPIALASAASVIANLTTSMTVVSLLRISDKLRCDFPPGLSGIKNGAPISHKWAKGRRRHELWAHPSRRPERLKLELN